MQAPAPHPAESQRLEDLYDYGILDTAAERVFDEIAELAAAICGTRYAAITLIDRDRQWFKARYGLDMEETSRDESVCGHAILETGLFEVPDTETDARFAGNPMLRRAPGIRFYGGSQLRSGRGNPIGMLCVLDSAPHQLTETQRQSLRQLADVLMAVLEAGRKDRLLQWFGALVDNTLDEIFIADPDTLFYLHANGSAQRNTGYSLERLKQMTPMQLAEETDRPRFEGYVARLRAGEQHVTFEGRRRRADGSTYPVEVRWQLLATKGRPVLLSHVHDISERRAVERMKSEFISVVNHELRTPLTSIHGAVKLLEQGAAGTLPAPAARLVSLAVENTSRLRRIVDDILDLEKIASGRMEFSVEPLRAAAVLGKVAGEYEPAASRAGVSLRVEAPEALGLRGDAQRVHQVLLNFVSNAVKFSPAGSMVTLRARQPGDTGRMRLEVLDTGPGVPAGFHERIFQRFAQADMKDSRSKGGSGLGLAIARQLAEQMGGSVGFESAPGHTVFYVDLPGESA